MSVYTDNVEPEQYQRMLDMDEEERLAYTTEYFQHERAYEMAEQGLVEVPVHHYHYVKVPVEKVVEKVVTKTVEVPVEKEVIKEVVKEVPVEVEVIKEVVDHLDEEKLAMLSQILDEVKSLKGQTVSIEAKNPCQSYMLDSGLLQSATFQG